MNSRPAWRVIDGGGEERLALSLVHPRQTIDIPVREVREIEARADLLLPLGGGDVVRVSGQANVALRFAPSIHAQIGRLTRRIVDEPMDIVVGGKCVSSPVVQEPLLGTLGFFISAIDFAEAEALAERIRLGWVRPPLRLVSSLREL